MKKSLISTLHFYNNYGSVLQAFALKTVLEKRFRVAADIFPFRPELPEYEYFSDDGLKRHYRDKAAKFGAFRRDILGMPEKNAKAAEEAYSLLGQRPEDYDHFLCGSDIIWGKEFSALDPVYFLNYATGDKPRVAYAASAVLDGKGHTEDDVLFRKGLSNFTSIGVRETSAVEHIRKLKTDVEVTAVLDPTLLLDSNDYEVLEEDISEYCSKPYILSYFLTHDPAVVDYTCVLARILGLRVIHYFADYPDRIFPSDAGCFAFTGPGEFLSLVKNASFIFTNSFHGTCFSIIYRKPFYTYMAKRNLLSRVKDMTERLGLEGRFFKDFRDISGITSDMDYSKTEVLLQEHRKESLDFLSRALGEDYV